MEKALIQRIYREQQLAFSAKFTDIQRALDVSAHLRRNKEVSTITGVRRCGKSTLLRQIRAGLAPEAQVLYAGFDDPRYLSFAATDFETLYEIWLEEAVRDKPHYLFFDEIQNVQGWERWVDYFSKRPHTKVFVTGSNASLLSSELSTLLTGRHQELHLTPLSFREVYLSRRAAASTSADTPEGRAEARKLMVEYYEFGGFPRAFLDRDAAILNQYYSDIIERDILRRLRRANARYLTELGTILAAESTRLFNRSHVAKTLGLKDQVTVGRYTDAFVATYLYQELRAYSPSVRKQLRSLSKFYCVDHAMARESGLRSPVESGSSLEIMVQAELQRTGLDIYYWKSKDDFEVDFLLVDRRKPVAAVQVAYAVQDRRTQEREVRALQAVAQELKVKDLYLITYEDVPVLADGHIRSTSFSEFALNGLK